MSNYTIFGLDNADLLDAYNRMTALRSYAPVTQPLQFIDNSSAEDNFYIRSVSEDGGSGSWIVCRSIGGKATENGGHTCYVRVTIPIKLDNTHVSTTHTTDALIMLCKGNYPVMNYNYTSGASNKARRLTSYWDNYSGYTFPNSFETFDNAWVNKYASMTSQSTYTDLLKSLIREVPNINAQYINKNGTQSLYEINQYGVNLATYGIVYTYDKLPFPVFDADDPDFITNVKKYLLTGDDSGSVDPFDPQTPTKTVITDYKTNYKVSVTPYDADKSRTKFSIIAYNSEYIELSDSLVDTYGLNVKVGNVDLGDATQPVYPTLGFHTKFVAPSGSVPIGGTSINMKFHKLGSDETSGTFELLMNYKASSEVHCTPTMCSYIGADGTRTLNCPRVNITDGYRYTAPTGEYLDLLYRALDLDDLDKKYSDYDDENDDTSGSDTTYAGAGGLRTFTISDADFTTINNKLWSTDWTNVFKSSTIDPIRCVISCKSIPFTANNVSSGEIYIANMDTGLSKNYVKTTRTFDCGSIDIGFKRGDFTDISHASVRVYLPFIGWVELPADEVISRRAYPEVGLSAKTKRLYFKYIVDFVDGSCRCIISVGGTGENITERWLFDGNCAVDVPVTSDNHTQAVSNAIRSGVSAGLGVVTAIAGAYTGNGGAVAGGVLSAVQNAPNMFPTYSYTATSNGSGYINANMNRHIMIVVERANVQEPSNYLSRMGKPCNMVLPLGSIHGFTKCANVDVSGINATPNELSMIKSLLESGVYL